MYRCACHTIDSSTLFGDASVLAPGFGCAVLLLVTHLQRQRHPGVTARLDSSDGILRQLLHLKTSIPSELVALALLLVRHMNCRI